MLAERRKKVIYSNPRGTLWASDDTRIGKRLMESMGWKDGMGLGKDGSGSNKNITPNFSNQFESKGLGYKRKLNDWIEENNVYEQILSDLAQHHSKKISLPEESPKSNKEAKPKLARRISCRKFVKAKNLSTTDLNSVFLTKTSDISSKLSEIGDSSRDVSTDLKAKKFRKDDDKSEPTEAQLITVESKLSIEEYFKQKMQNKLRTVPDVQNGNFSKQENIETSKHDNRKRQKLKSNRKHKLA